MDGSGDDFSAVGFTFDVLKCRDMSGGMILSFLIKIPYATRIHPRYLLGGSLILVPVTTRILTFIGNSGNQHTITSGGE